MDLVSMTEKHSFCAGYSQVDKLVCTGLLPSLTITSCNAWLVRSKDFILKHYTAGTIFYLNVHLQVVTTISQVQLVLVLLAETYKEVLLELSSTH